MATTGLVLGYLFLVISVVMVPGFIEGIKAARDGKTLAPSGPSESLSSAERIVMSDSNGVANGNTAKARELAAKFSEEMKVIRDELFSEADGLDLTDGKFLTYCELHEDRCLFISQVPKFRKFEDDAKDQLGELAWAVAQRITQEELEPSDQLGVGLRGVFKYGQVRIGLQGDEQRPSLMTDKDERLQKFFPDESEAAGSMDEDIIDDELNIEIDIEEPAQDQQ